MLSIVIITRNRCKELKRAINSCEKHVSIEHEYIIIDNGSEDDTPNMIKELEVENIYYYYQNTNLGVAGGRNKGFRLSKGDICYYLDDDAVLVGEGYSLDNAYYFMKQHNNIKAMGTDCYDLQREDYLRPLHVKGTSNDLDGLIRGFVGVSHFIKKANWNSNYLYPDLYPYGGEELYIGLKAYKHNDYVYYYSDVKVIHMPSNNTRFDRNQTRIWSYVNEMLIKTYFAPKVYLPICWIFFVLRVIKGSNCSVGDLISSIRAYNKQKKKQYIDRMTIEQSNRLIRMFGIKMIL